MTQHFGQSLDQARLAQAAAQATKEEVKRMVFDNARAVRLETKYERDRRTFRERHARLVWDVLTISRPHLVNDFSLAGLDESQVPLT